MKQNKRRSKDQGAVPSAREMTFQKEYGFSGYLGFVLIGYGNTDMKMTSKKENVLILADPWKQEALVHGEHQGLMG